MTRLSVFRAATFCALAMSASLCAAGLFQHVVSLGDSLMDDPDGTRSPLASEQVAARLGAPLTKLAVSGSNSDQLIQQGQHATAAARFGHGDLAMLWIGGNDFFDNVVSVAFGGGASTLDHLTSNVDQVLGTLRGAGMDVVVFNLPDMARVPAVQIGVTAITPFGIGRQAILNNFTELSADWSSRLDGLAAKHGATMVDVFSLFNQRLADPQAFAILDHSVNLGPQYGGQFDVFADVIHPSAYMQGVIANASFAEIASAYDPLGTMPLPPLSVPELAPLSRLLAGDFNEGGVVNAADLAIWRSGYGRGSGAGTHFTGDATDDDRVDGADFLVWQRESGRMISTTAAVATVPEPAATMLLMIALTISLSGVRYSSGPNSLAKLSAPRLSAGRSR